MRYLLPIFLSLFIGCALDTSVFDPADREYGWVDFDTATLSSTYYDLEDGTPPTEQEGLSCRGSLDDYPDIEPLVHFHNCAVEVTFHEFYEDVANIVGRFPAKNRFTIFIIDFEPSLENENIIGYVTVRIDNIIPAHLRREFETPEDTRSYLLRRIELNSDYTASMPLYETLSSHFGAGCQEIMSVSLMFNFQPDGTLHSVTRVTRTEFDRNPGSISGCQIAQGMLSNSILNENENKSGTPIEPYVSWGAVSVPYLGLISTLSGEMTGRVVE